MPNDDGHRTSIAVGEGWRGTPNQAAADGLGTQMPIQPRGTPWGDLSGNIAPLSHNYELELTFGRTKPETFDIPGTQFTEPPLGVFSIVIATSTWVDGALPYVTGNDLTLATSAKVYLPRGSNQDPNVRSGNVLVCLRDVEGNYYATGNGYLDGQIGEVRMFTGSASSIRAGWQLHAASADKFIKASNGSGSNIGNTGGSNSHSHSLSLTSDSAATGITATDQATTGASVASNSTGISATASNTDTYSGTTATGYENISINNYSGNSGNSYTGITYTDYAETGITMETEALDIVDGGGSLSLGPLMQFVQGTDPGDPWCIGQTISVMGDPPTEFCVTTNFCGDADPFEISPHTHSHVLVEPDIDEDPMTTDDNGHYHTITDVQHYHTIIHGHSYSAGGHTHDYSGSTAGHAHSISDPGHGHTLSEGSGHTHNLTDPEHTHPISGTSGSASSEPAYYVLAFIERVH